LPTNKHGRTVSAAAFLQNSRVGRRFLLRQTGRLKPAVWGESDETIYYFRYPAVFTDRYHLGGRPLPFRINHEP